MSMIDKAIAFAATAHEDQRRKYTGDPYIVHPIEVMQILRRFNVEDEAMLCAAVLHDVIEDTNVGYIEIQREFGDDVAELVVALTDAKVQGNRAFRKAYDRDRLAHVSPRAQTIKIADLLSNTRDITKNDANFARVYLKEKAALLKVLTKAQPDILLQAQRELAIHLSKFHMEDLIDVDTRHGGSDVLSPLVAEPTPA